MRVAPGACICNTEAVGAGRADDGVYGSVLANYGVEDVCGEGWVVCVMWCAWHYRHWDLEGKFSAMR